MNKMISEQEMQNEMLEKELLNLKQGVSSFDEFERIMGHSEVELQKLKKLMPGKGKRMGNKNNPFPEDFVFRQNEFRNEDLEVEERALMNLTAQEYDALRQISKLPVNSELYRYKMD